MSRILGVADTNQSAIKHIDGKISDGKASHDDRKLSKLQDELLEAEVRVRDTIRHAAKALKKAPISRGGMSIR